MSRRAGGHWFSWRWKWYGPVPMQSGLAGILTGKILDWSTGTLPKNTEAYDIAKNDGWTITDDPLTLSYGGRDLYVDLAAERLTIGAERNGEKIAVEIHSFLNPSPVRDLEEAVGQYDIYRSILTDTGSDRLLFLAVPQHVYGALLDTAPGRDLVAAYTLRLVVYDADSEVITEWIE